MTALLTPIDILADVIRAHGPIPTVRVSSAQSGTRYNYWGAVRYELRLTRDGRVANIAQERASSDRRSRRLAERDAEEIAEREGRIELQTIGTVGPSTAASVVDDLISRPQAHAIREQKNRALANLRATPHWVERAAAGVLSVGRPWLSDAERESIGARASEIKQLRDHRAAARYVCVPREFTRRAAYHGIPIVIHGQRWSWKKGGQVRYLPDTASPSTDSFRTRREAAQAYLRARVRRYGELELLRRGAEWVLRDRTTYRATRYATRPSRVELVAAIIRHANAGAVQHG